QGDLRDLRPIVKKENQLLGATAQHGTGLISASDDPLAVRELEHEPGTPELVGQHPGPPTEGGPQGQVELRLVSRLPSRSGPANVLCMDEELEQVDHVVERPNQQRWPSPNLRYESRVAVAPERSLHREFSEIRERAVEDEARHGQRTALAHEHVSCQVLRQPTFAEGRSVGTDLHQHVAETLALRPSEMRSTHTDSFRLG